MPLNHGWQAGLSWPSQLIMTLFMTELMAVEGPLSYLNEVRGGP